jgi:hypothetical protein
VVLWFSAALLGDGACAAVEPEPTLLGGVWLVTAGVPGGGFVVPVLLWFWFCSVAAVPAAGGTF